MQMEVLSLSRVNVEGEHGGRAWREREMET